jgi:hypothetical protein
MAGRRAQEPAGDGRLSRCGPAGNEEGGIAGARFGSGAWVRGKFDVFSSISPIYAR